MVDRHPVKCLVVDDDHQGAEICGEFLRALGAEVQVVYSGQAAIDIGPDFQPQMVVLDINMPDIDGFETCRRLKQQSWSGNTRFVAYTAMPPRDAVAAAAGFDRVVSKGDSPVLFERILNDLGGEG